MHRIKNYIKHYTPSARVQQYHNTKHVNGDFFLNHLHHIKENLAKIPRGNVVQNMEE